MYSKTGWVLKVSIVPYNNYRCVALLLLGEKSRYRDDNYSDFDHHQDFST